MEDAGFAPFDLVFFYGRSATGSAISWGTFSAFSPAKFRIGPSHVAVICDDPRGSGLLLVESTTLSNRKCVIRGEKVSGVQAHRPSDRLHDYLAAGGRAAAYRIPRLIRDQLDFELKREAFAKMLVSGFVERDTGYDMTRAVMSGSRLFSLSRLMPWSDLSTVFCSELAAFADMWLGILPWQNQQKFSPGRLLRTQVRSGVREEAWSLSLVCEQRKLSCNIFESEPSHEV